MSHEMKPTTLARRLCFPAVIFIITLAVFSQVINADFVMWDDDNIIYKNGNLGPLSLDKILWAFTDVDSMMRYNPLTLISWCATYSIFGLDPFGYHLGNLLLHCSSSVVLFFIFKKILSHPSLHPAGQGITSSRVATVSLIATLLWALHPLRVEPVSWATDRTYCQAFFFITLSTLFYLQANEHAGEGRGYFSRMAASFACYFLSLLSYANGITFFLIFLVLDIFLYKRVGSGAGWWRSPQVKKVLAEKALFAVPAVAVALVSTIVRIQSAGVWKPAVSLSDFGVLDRIMQALYITAYYVYRQFYPFDLAPVYTSLVTFDPVSFPFLLRAFGVIAVTVLALIYRKRFPLLLAAVVSYLVLLVPVVGFFEHPHYHVDRYSILPSLPLVLLVGVLLLKIEKETLQRTMSSAALIVVLCLGVLSFQQTKVWYNSETLFGHMLKTLKDDPYQQDIHWRLGKYLYLKGEKEKASLSFINTLRLNPNHKLARFYLYYCQK